jgi:hypothetical protein
VPSARRLDTAGVQFRLGFDFPRAARATLHEAPNIWHGKLRRQWDRRRIDITLATALAAVGLQELAFPDQMTDGHWADHTECAFVIHA